MSPSLANRSPKRGHLNDDDPARLNIIAYLPYSNVGERAGTNWLVCEFGSFLISVYWPVIIIVRGERILIKDVAQDGVSKSLAATNRIASGTLARGRDRTDRRPGDEYSRSGIPRSIVLQNEIIV